MIPQIERKAFATRLGEALRNSRLVSDSPTVLQRNLSLRGVNVTVHAARKWLLGEAIPKQDNLIRIASWLGVQPNWLRFGIGDGGTTIPASELIEPHVIRMLNGFRQLKERDQALVQTLVESMLSSAKESEVDNREAA